MDSNIIKRMFKPKVLVVIYNLNDITSKIQLLDINKWLGFSDIKNLNFFISANHFLISGIWPSKTRNFYFKKIYQKRFFDIRKYLKNITKWHFIIPHIKHLIFDNTILGGFSDLENRISDIKYWRIFFVSDSKYI